MSEAIEPGLEMAERQDRFVAEHLRRIFAQIYHIVRNVADAQDLTQEAFIKALQHQEQLKDEQKAAHWLSRIATNTAIDFLRRSGRAQFCEIDDSHYTGSESPEQLLSAQRAPGIPGGRSAVVEPSGTRGVNAARCGGHGGGRSGRAPKLLEGHGPFAYRQCAHQAAAVYGKKEAVGR